MKGADLMQTNVNGLASLPSHQLAMTLLMTPDMANFRFEEANLRKALRRELVARHHAMKHPPQV
jgi:hypothetical protein